MYNSLEKKSSDLWGLWADYSWRELAVAGGVIATTAFVAYCICNTQGPINYLKLNKSSAGLLAGFFIPLSVVTYPTIYRNNQLRKNNLTVYMEIGTELSKVEQLNQLHGPSNPLIEKLIETIKNKAHACLNLEHSDKNITYTDHLLQINELLIKIQTYIHHFFFYEFTNVVDLIDSANLIEQVEFWNQDEERLKTFFLNEYIEEEVNDLALSLSN